MKNYTLQLLLLMCSLSIMAQETLTFSNYDGGNLSIIATSTVNDEITIVFEDLDIVNNFYTENQNEIYMYGGLNTTNGSFQGTPDFNTLEDQPVLTLHNDSDNTVGPNRYSITINLASHYDDVPDGTDVFGFNLLFQNQYGEGGNNQTSDLYIDLTDAVKNVTLNASSNLYLKNVKISVKNRMLKVIGIETPIELSIYNILGQNVLRKSVSSQDIVNLSKQPKGIYIVKLNTKNASRTLKIILD